MQNKKNRLLPFIFCFSVGLSAFGQNETAPVPSVQSEPTTEKGVRITPIGGNWGLGFNAIELVKNFSQFKDDFQIVQQTIYGKHFLGSPTDSYNGMKAIRARFSVDNSRKVMLNSVIDNSLAVPDTNVFVTDRLTARTTNMTLGLGMDFRRGSGRFYGIYGGEIILSYTSGTNLYDYGNGMSTGNQTPTTTTNFYSKKPSVAAIRNRVTYEKIDPTFGIGLNAIAGIEYFFAPRSAVYLEFGLGLVYKDYKNTVRKYEAWDNVNSADITLTHIKPAGNELSVTSGIFRSSLNFLFYF